MFTNDPGATICKAVAPGSFAEGLPSMFQACGKSIQTRVVNGFDRFYGNLHRWGALWNIMWLRSSLVRTFILRHPLHWECLQPRC